MEYVNDLTKVSADEVAYDDKFSLSLVDVAQLAILGGPVGHYKSVVFVTKCGEVMMCSVDGRMCPGGNQKIVFKKKQ